MKKLALLLIFSATVVAYSQSYVNTELTLIADSAFIGNEVLITFSDVVPMSGDSIYSIGDENVLLYIIPKSYGVYNIEVPTNQIRIYVRIYINTQIYSKFIYTFYHE